MKSSEIYVYALLIILMSFVLLNPVRAGYEADEDSADTPTITQEQLLIEHTVRPNEQLHLLAGYYLLNSRRWTEIRDWNPDKVTNPNIIHPGDVLKIWVAPEWEPPYDLDAYLEEYRMLRR